MTDNKLLFDIRNSFRKRKVFYSCMLFIAALLILDIWTVSSFLFAFFSGEMGEEYISTLLIDDWFSCFGYILLIAMYLFVLVWMSYKLLSNAAKDHFLPVPFFLLWHSAIGLFSTVGNLGHYFLWRSFFVSVSDAMDAIAFFPLLLCFTYLMKKYIKVVLPAVLLDGFVSAVYLLACAFFKDSSFAAVVQTVSDCTFLLCFMMILLFGILEAVKEKNESFNRFPVIVIAMAAGYILVVGFSALLLPSVFQLFSDRIFPDGVFSLHSMRINIVQWALFLITILLVLQNNVREILNRRLEEQAMELRYAANEEYADSLHRYEQSVREIKHDIANNLNVAAMLCKNGEYEKLEEYLSSMTDQVSAAKGKIFCSNTLANYLLQMFDERMQEKEIDFRCEAYLPWDLQIPDRDLASVMNNVLQNAMDAAAQKPEGERWVEYRMVYERKVVRITCRNSYADEPQTNDVGEIKTSKKDKKSHGLGLGIIRKTAEKYGGAASVSFKEGVFEIHVAIPLTDG